MGAFGWSEHGGDVHGRFGWPQLARGHGEVGEDGRASWRGRGLIGGGPSGGIDRGEWLILVRIGWS